MKQKIFYIDGNIGVGKTTFLDFIQKHFPDIQVILEPVEEWLKTKTNEGKNMLELFYADPHKNAAMFNMYSSLTKFQRLDAIDKQKKIVVIERSFETDQELFGYVGFESGSLNEIQFKVHDYFCSFLKKYFYVPKGKYIYLRTTPEIAHKRCIKRARKGEETIPLSYIKQIHLQLDKLFLKKNPICIDVSEELLSKEEYFEKMMPILKNIFKIEK